MKQLKNGEDKKKRRGKAEKQVLPSRELARWRSASAENNGPNFRGAGAHTHTHLIIQFMFEWN